MTTDELYGLLSDDLAEIKADQKETCKYVKELNGRVIKNTLSLRIIWGAFGLGWAAFLVWLRGKTT